jgi:hypothetical protein
MRVTWCRESSKPLERALLRIDGCGYVVSVESSEKWVAGAATNGVWREHPSRICSLAAVLDRLANQLFTSLLLTPMLPAKIHSKAPEAFDIKKETRWKFDSFAQVHNSSGQLFGTQPCKRSDVYALLRHI